MEKLERREKRAQVRMRKQWDKLRSTLHNQIMEKVNDGSS